MTIYEENLESCQVGFNQNTMQYSLMVKIAPDEAIEVGSGTFDEMEMARILISMPADMRGN